jgi:hypothetical protein
MKKNLIVDLVVYDELSIIHYPHDGTHKPIEYTTTSLVTKALGGTEFQLLLLMNECAAQGKTVVCFNNNLTESLTNNIAFIPRQDMNKYNIKCKNLILSRYSRIPMDVKFEKCLIWMHDVAMPMCIGYDQLFKQSDKFSIVCPSNWSRSLFPKSWPVYVINNMIPDWVYDYQCPVDRTDFIYASAALKGLPDTLLFWDYITHNNIISNTKLRILSPGYDTPRKDEVQSDTVEFIGAIPFHRVVEEISKSKSLFFVNSMPETFCIVAVLCEILGTRIHILPTKGAGALPETLSNTTGIYTDYMEFIHHTPVFSSRVPAKDYRVSKVMKQWNSILI